MTTPENYQSKQMKTPSKEWLQKLAGTTDEPEIGAGVPSTKYTPLERMLVNIVIKELVGGVESPEDLHQSVRGVDTKVQSYINTLTQCEEARQTRRGYTVETITDEQKRKQERIRLITLQTTGLVRQTGTYGNKAALKNDPDASHTFFAIYQTSEHGTQLLEEHKKMKHTGK